MVVDIGSILFVDVLGMTMYPGSPFTANIVRDVIMFFFIPTVFLIMIMYVLLGRIFTLNRQLRLLLGVALYLFVIAGGYFKTFALLAGPYFIFLIFVLGFVYFIPTHFRTRTHGLSKSAFADTRLEGEDHEALSILTERSINPLEVRRLKQIEKDLERRISDMDKAIAQGGGKADNALVQRDKLEERLLQIQRRLGKR